MARPETDWEKDGVNSPWLEKPSSELGAYKVPLTIVAERLATLLEPENRRRQLCKALAGWS